MNDPTLDEVIGELSQELSRTYLQGFDAKVNDLGNCVVQLLAAVEGGRPTGFGSSVLLSRNGRTFLCTAKHVLDDAKAEDTTLYIGVPGTPIVLAGESVQAPADDIAILDVTSMEGQLSSFRTLGPKDVHDPSVAITGYYAAAVGYPGTKTRRDHQQPVVRSTKYALSGLVENEAGNEIRMHFRRSAMTVAGERRRITAPEPYGMSGGALFCCPVSTSAAIDGPSPKLAGISIEWRSQQNRIVATTIAVPLFLIEQALQD